jgi:3-deoxy-manno-octulosonate cytidylyltransferase (CMP-KDO synthetase)
MKIAIPARYASTRFPGKPLVAIAGRPMIEHVWRRAVLAADAPEDVYIATDDNRIKDAAAAFGAQVVITSSDHENGTDRLAELATVLGLDDSEIVVNIQGDEPLIDPALIRLVAQCLADTPTADMATAISPIEDASLVQDPNVVKVVAQKNGFAQYFSRATIPHNRDGGPLAGVEYLRHIGIYAYRTATLKALSALEPAPSEMAEKLEQLRALWHGYGIMTALYDGPPAIGVDTPDDLVRVEAAMTGAST